MSFRQFHRLFILGFAGSLLSLGCTQTIASKVIESPVTDSPAPVATSTSPDTVAQTPATTTPPQKEPDVVYLPTPQVVVDKMLELAQVSKNDVVYDLGSGDGRIVITAAKQFGARGIGIELRPELVQEARENAKKAGVANQVEFRQADLFATDFGEASVVTLYLLPTLNVKLRPKLLNDLKPGTRIVSHDFKMGDWQPEQTVRVKGPNREHLIYVWRVPEQIPANLR